MQLPYAAKVQLFSQLQLPESQLVPAAGAARFAAALVAAAFGGITAAPRYFQNFPELEEIPRIGKIFLLMEGI